MQVVDILSAGRIEIVKVHPGALNTKAVAIRRLAELLVRGAPQLDPDEVERLLQKREQQQSTGVGGGVAIPHAAVEALEHIVGALLLCPRPIAFDAVDGEPVSILFAVVGPKKGVGEHLKTLARVSRLLRDDSFRARLVGAEDSAAAYGLILAEEGRAA